MHEIDDERPIPVGRAAAETAVGRDAAAAAGGNRGHHAHDCPEAREFLVSTGIHQDGNRGVPTHDCPEARQSLVANGSHQDASRSHDTNDRPEPSEPAPAWPVSVEVERLAVGPAPTLHIERTRPAPGVVPALPMPAAVMPAVAEPIGSRPPLVGTSSHQNFAAEVPVRGEHPLATLRGFRFEAALVEPAFGGRRRDLGRFLAAFVLAMAVVLGLIAAFLALAGGTHA